MAERVYPTTKPPTATAAPPTATTKLPPPPSFPPTKSQLYNASRPTIYRPQQLQNHHRPSRRSRRCCCCLCTLLTLLLLILIASITGAVFYFIYSPHPPNFSISSLKITQFNLTSSSTLHTKFNLTVVSSNPSNKIKFLYNPISISVVSSAHNIPLGTTTLPHFIHTTKNITTFRPQIVTNNELDAESTTNLKSEMKSKHGIKLKIKMNTKVKVQIGNKQSYKIPIRVLCNGIKAVLPVAKTPVTATITDHKCKVDLRITIWKWTF